MGFEDIKGALGDTIEEAPFVRTLKHSSHFTIIRNSVEDLYKRGWCLVEFLYARKLGLYPDKTCIAGPTKFADSTSSVMDIEASLKADREKILRELFEEKSVQELDDLIAECRSFDIDDRR